MLKNDSEHPETIITKDFQISDWNVDGFENNENFEKIETGIKVKSDGAYFVYANVVLTGKGRNCAYDLNFGSKKRECRVFSIWKSSSNLTRDDMVSQRQPCYLGFSAKLNKSDELSIAIHQKPQCDFESRTAIAKMVKNSYLGIFKLS